MKTLNYIKTFLIHFNYLLLLLKFEIIKLTNERLLAKQLIKKTKLIEGKPNPVLLEKYKDMVERSNKEVKQYYKTKTVYENNIQ